MADGSGHGWIKGGYMYRPEVAGSGPVGYHRAITTRFEVVRLHADVVLRSIRSIPI